jgi:hypothetical protein
MTETCLSAGGSPTSGLITSQRLIRNFGYEWRALHPAQGAIDPLELVRRDTTEAVRKTSRSQSVTGILSAYLSFGKRHASIH